MSMDLQRLKVYINERVKESKRLEEWANTNGHDALAYSHYHSQQVGREILKEIEESAKS